MSRWKRLSLWSPFLIAIVILILYSLRLMFFTDTQNKIPINNIGNTNNGGALFEEKGVLYGRIIPATDGSGYFNLSSKKNDGSETIIETGHDVSNVVVYNNTIFYRDTDIVIPFFQVNYLDFDSGAIYAINIQGGDAVRITGELVDNFYIYNNKIFFQVGEIKESNSGDHSYITNIYCCSLDGEDKQHLYSYVSQEPSAGLFSIYSDSIYLPVESNVIRYNLSTHQESACIHMVPGDLKIVKVLSAVPIKNEVFVDVQISGNFNGMQSRLGKVDIAGRLTIISQENLQGFTSDENYIYYVANGKLNLFNLKHQKIERIDRSVSGLPIIIGNEIFYLDIHNHGGTAEFRRISTDRGTVLKTRGRQGDGSSVLTKSQKGDDIPSNSEMSK